jgi:plasmid stabilization system protein ParE
MAELEPYRVVISARAGADLRAIFDYIAQDSPRNAAKVIDGLLSAMDALVLFPRRYPVVASRRRPRHETRLMPVRPYLVYYRIIESDRVVLMAEVCHGARRRPRNPGS